jgi:ABC-type Mn2+/Zn2+ transport system ATPase subunit
VSEAVLAVRHAALGYGRAAILKDVELSIEPGSFWAILGPNGAGKTTLLRALLGLLACRKGKVQARAGLRFGYVPQKERLDPIYPLSAYDVAALGTYREIGWGGLFHRTAEDLVHRCLRDCGADAFSRKRYAELSGGQRQRVLIARALAAQPEVLALDEPLAGIDAETQEALLKLLGRLKDDHRLTVLMVSHRIVAEQSLFTHIAWVDEGRVETGTARQMLAGSRASRYFAGGF